MKTTAEARRIILDAIEDYKAGRITPAMASTLSVMVATVNNSLDAETRQQKVLLLLGRHVPETGDMKL